MRQPVQVISGQQYGQRQALANAQRTIPLPNTTGTPPPAAPVATPAAPAAPPPTPAAAPMPPGGAGAFNRPTERPDEPVTTGLPYGPGPGPEAVQANVNQDALDVQHWQRYMPQLEFMASQPDASQSMINFARRVRSMLPPQGTP